MDALYAASDASHRARGWEVRRGTFGGRRYRPDVAAWLESQRRLERFGSTPGPVLVVRDEAADVFDAMRWTQDDLTPVLRAAIELGRRADIVPASWATLPADRVICDGQEAA
ncbi:hypothetical protein F1D05_33405 [Kribbella qitaiheensis]|uniref:Uncharacterized protein n=1 Tax=Kribbella qitaiheensis TaxID=1544730 RepID=A0A7G6X6Q4_9ACTN|nr:hypothetical protein [Kribbella qitaiheensis]QNE21919.1 hypothetical protein F1D05_33405 [Kribbella qitaiheensis]